MLFNLFKLLFSLQTVEAQLKELAKFKAFLFELSELVATRAAIERVQLVKTKLTAIKQHNDLVSKVETNVAKSEEVVNTLDGQLRSLDDDTLGFKLRAILEGQEVTED